MVSVLRQGNSLEEVRCSLDRSLPFPSRLIHQCANRDYLSIHIHGIGQGGVLAQSSEYCPLHRLVCKTLAPVSSSSLLYDTSFLGGRAVSKELPTDNFLVHIAVHVELLWGRKLL